MDLIDVLHRVWQAFNEGKELLFVCTSAGRTVYVPVPATGVGVHALAERLYAHNYTILS